MRLHRLEVQAFGPYAERQDIDFDQLNDAGVFLLTGPTGAGKTSVLDAVCFALYGVVPGLRDTRSLRSSVAEPQTPTRVLLELTLGGRRLRVERWPAWERPKKRGTGTTLEPAGARLTEIDPDGTETLLSGRAQEVGHELGPLLAMSSEQFMQVVLLPQGGFASFLQATSEQRRDLLEQLFSSQRFARIEGWVHERATWLRARSEDRRAEALQVLAALAHRADREAPEQLDDAVLDAWRAQVRDDMRSAVTVARRAERSAARVAQDRQAVEQRLAHDVRLVARRDAARADLRDLDETEDEARELARTVTAHRRAAALAPVLDAVGDAEAQVSQCQAVLDDAPADAPTDLSTCREQLVEAQRRLGGLQALADTVARLEQAEARETELRADQARVLEQLELLETELSGSPARRAVLRDALAEAQALSGQLDQHRAALTAAEQVARAVAELGPAQEALQQAERRALERSARLNDARARHLDLVERRLAGMAAELAAGLTDGDPCVVCGSLAHPAPATAAPDAVTAREQQAAERAVGSASSEHDEAQRDLQERRRVLLPLQQQVGDLDPGAARELLEQARARLGESEQARDTEAVLARELAQLELAEQTLADRIADARRRREDAATRLEEVGRLVDDLRPVVTASIGEETLAVATRRMNARVEELTGAVRALEAHAEAVAQLSRARARATEAARGAGFDDLPSATVALLGDVELARAEQTLSGRDSTRARAEEVLVDPEVRRLEEVETPVDEAALARAREAATEALEAHRVARSALDRAEECHGKVRELDALLGSRLDAWRPVREQHRLAESVSGLVRGTSPDNQLQVRLSSYVLMTQLDLVLDAANERLRHMRDNRYTLHRAVRGSRSRSRTGLDLEVMDEWSGQARSPATLSGGETFKVSLALALGLADVIRHESGGLDIDTLFIDEGFGMLDPDTLDEVMDCIDDLRGGGRSVGVVSHVTELMSRIGTQLHVEPSRAGSRVRVTTSVV